MFLAKGLLSKERSMNIRIVFKGMDHSFPFEEHTQQHLTQKLSKFMHKESPLALDVVVESVHGNQSYVVEIRLNSQHYHLVAHQRGSDLYKTFDTTVNILVDEVKRHKEKMLDARNHMVDPLRDASKK